MTCRNPDFDGQAALQSDAPVPLPPDTEARKKSKALVRATGEVCQGSLKDTFSNHLKHGFALQGETTIDKAMFRCIM